jgi:diguanylate cyclase (GGDEF)-like protein/PAS domain S-box-containing protein
MGFESLRTESSCELLSLLSENIPDLLWVKDLKGKYIFANKALCERLLMAVSLDEPIGKNDMFFTLRERSKYPENLQWHTFGELCCNSDEQVIQHNKPMRFEEYGHIKGEMFYLDVHKAPFYNSKGEIIGTVGTGRDITEFKNIQNSLENALDTLEQAQKIAQLGFWEHRIDTGEGIWSTENYHIFGVTPEEYNPTILSFNQFVCETDVLRVKEAIEQSIECKKSFEIQCKIIKPNLQAAHILSRGKVTFNGKGKPEKIIGTSLDITERILMEKALRKEKERYEYHAYHDALTNLPNRLLCIDRLQQSIERAKRSQNKVAVLFIDLDHFKEINDSLGHNIGDAVLIEIANRMRVKMRASDTLARLGGDEFCIVLNDIKSINDIAEIIENSMSVTKKPIDMQGHSLYVGMSIGVSVFPNDGDSPDELLKNSDTAMYKSKSSGRNSYNFYNEGMGDMAFERLLLLNALKTAVKEKQFEIYYQPQVDGLTGDIVGMEALARWIHPKLGMVFPDKFIPLAEETGIVVDIDRFIMRKAFEQFLHWQRSGFNPGKLALNISIKNLEKNDFLDMLKRELNKVNFNKDNLVLEVTESGVMKEPLKTINILNNISNLGIRIAIDDFGTGYSSLAYLKRLPINKLKIDRSFIKNLPDNDEDVVIAKTIINLAQNLDLNIIAEGVETKQQLDFLIENNCNIIQGFYYSKPLPVAEIQVLLESKFLN